jgi:hypothetical protein
MTTDAAIVDLEIEWLPTERRRHADRMSSSQKVLPAIKMCSSASGASMSSA